MGTYLSLDNDVLRQVVDDVQFFLGYGAQAHLAKLNCGWPWATHSAKSTPLKQAFQIIGDNNDEQEGDSNLCVLNKHNSLTILLTTVTTMMMIIIQFTGTRTTNYQETITENCVVCTKFLTFWGQDHGRFYVPCVSCIHGESFGR